MAIKIVYDIYDHIAKSGRDCFSASQIADTFHISRSSASSYLNELYRMEKLPKTLGKPVLYHLPSEDGQESSNIFYATYGRDSIYAKPIELAIIHEGLLFFFHRSLNHPSFVGSTCP